jgi:putative ABC transport system ATP-binding protein
MTCPVRDVRSIDSVDPPGRAVTVVTAAETGECVRARQSDAEAPPDTPVVRAEGVSRTFNVHGGKVHALRGVDLVIEQGQMVALKGRSGSGKTTLLNLIGGLDRPTAGQVFFYGREIGRMPDGALTRLRRASIGFVFQSFALMPILSAYENVELPMRIAGASAKQRAERVAELLEMVGLTKRAKHRAFELSGGEQQRVAIARSLVNRPALILADEPTGELDSHTGLAIMRLFRRVIETEDVTVCLTTHDPIIMEIADITHEIVDGQLTLAQ